MIGINPTQKAQIKADPIRIDQIETAQTKAVISGVAIAGTKITQTKAVQIRIAETKVVDTKAAVTKVVETRAVTAAGTTIGQADDQAAVATSVAVDQAVEIKAGMEADALHPDPEADSVAAAVDQAVVATLAEAEADQVEAVVSAGDDLTADPMDDLVDDQAAAVLAAAEAEADLVVAADEAQIDEMIAEMTEATIVETIGATNAMKTYASPNQTSSIKITGSFSSTNPRGSPLARVRRPHSSTWSINSPALANG